MSDPYLTTFIAGIAGKDDESLLRTLARVTAAPDEYHPEAIAAVRKEVARRGLTTAPRTEAEQPVNDDWLDHVQHDAGELARAGYSLEKIETDLNARGVNRDIAAAMARQAWSMPAEARRRAGRWNVLSGAALCLLGLTFIAVSYFAGSETRDGRFVLVWGAVVIGALQVVRGVRQSSRRNRAYDARVKE